MLHDSLFSNNWTRYIYIWNSCEMNNIVQLLRWKFCHNYCALMVWSESRIKLLIVFVPNFYGWQYNNVIPILHLFKIAIMIQNMFLCHNNNTYIFEIKCIFISLLGTARYLNLAFMCIILCYLISRQYPPGECYSNTISSTI